MMTDLWLIMGVLLCAFFAALFLLATLFIPLSPYTLGYVIAILIMIYLGAQVLDRLRHE